MQNNEWRSEFAAFLDRLANGHQSPIDWSNRVVTHYDDEELEAIRRDVVRLFAKYPPFENVTATHTEVKLREWSRVLRDSCS